MSKGFWEGFWYGWCKVAPYGLAFVVVVILLRALLGVW